MRQKKLFSCLACAAMAVLPTTVLAAESVTICVKNPEDAVTNSEVDVIVNGVVANIEKQRMEDGCLRLKLVECSGSVVIRAKGNWIYKETEAVCSTDPTPLVIAMEYRDLPVVMAAFDPNGLVPSDFETELGSVLKESAPVLTALSPQAERTGILAMAALSDGDYATAQFYANEAASYLRQADRSDLSVAYSSLTYVTGLRAIGVDPFNPENPLVKASPDNVEAMVVLTDEGENVLKAYRNLTQITAAKAAYDFQTAKGIKSATSGAFHGVEKATAAPPVAVPTGGWSKFTLGVNGQVKF